MNILIAEHDKYNICISSAEDDPDGGLMPAPKKKDVLTLCVLLTPVIVFTIFLASTPPAYVNGINFRANLNQSITKSELANMTKTLEEEGWNISYPAPVPYTSPNSSFTDKMILIEFQRSQIWLVSGNNSYFMGEWSYKLDIWTGEGSIMEQKAVINSVLEKISQSLSLNYSEENLNIDDNDFELMNYDIERISYSLCIGATIGGIIVFAFHRSDMWRLMLKDSQVLESFILLTIGFFPTWTLIEASRGLFKMNPVCNSILIPFIGLIIMAIINLRKTVQEMG